MIRIGLIQFPGSNCERETALTLKRVGMEPVEFLWNEPLDTLRSLDGYIIVGGFSYEDRSRAGIIAALDPVMQEIKAQSEKGKPVLGICNGAQILVESGLIPGLNKPSVMALAENKRIANEKIIGTGYYNTWVRIRLADSHQQNAFTAYLSSSDLIHLPVAHAEGRFLLSQDLLQELEKEGLNLFQYCDAEGRIINNFPTNPNGSIANLAAVSNKAGNVMAMMPHPERTPNGDPIFKSMHDYITKERNNFAGQAIAKPRFSQRPQVQEFNKIPGSQLCLVQLIINDNQALTVQKTLRRLGFPVTVKRFEHWEIEADSLESIIELKQSELLYCNRKEREVTKEEFHAASSFSFLLRAKDDLRGQQTLQTLKTHYAIPQIKGLKHGVVWQFKSEEGELSKLIEPILLTHIIGNPYAHECYNYR